LLGLPNVDGTFVGRASLEAADFMAIAATYA
jgi:triosephosphate isomerase